MVLSRGKRTITLIWCVLECLFFSGLLNGWTWMQNILKEEGYFSNYCNNSFKITEVYQDLSDSRLENPLTKFRHQGNLICFYRLVLKEHAYKEMTTPLQTMPEQEALSFDDPLMNKTYVKCPEQDDHLEFVLTIVVIVRNALMLPLGIFLDRYGTSRTRIIAMICIAVGSLTMLFSSQTYPWTILPSLLILGVSGMLVLLTDLQIANLFGEYRHTVMSAIVGSYSSGGLVMFLKKIVHSTGITIQTSFMFVTIGIVPVLISTIAMLPRSRIPWPLPAEYGTSKRVDFAEDRISKSLTWHRRMTVSIDVRSDIADFLPFVKSKLYICMVLWLAILCLKSIMFDLSISQQLKQVDEGQSEDYVSLYASIMLFSLPFSPLVGLLMDSAKCQKVNQQPHTQQMINISNAVCVNYIVAVCSSVTSLFPNIYLQFTACVLGAIEKVLILSTFFAFLTHVHFPIEHFGKLAGLSLAVTGMFNIIQFPLHVFLKQGLPKNIIYVRIGMLLLLLLAACHPISLWYHCKADLIENNDFITRKNLQSLSMHMIEDIDRSPVEDDGNVESGETDKKDCQKSAKLQITDL